MVMPSEESLSSGKNMSDHDCCAEGVDYVLVVRMEQKSVVDVSWIGREIPEKPITALI